MSTDDAVADLLDYCKFTEDRVYIFMAIARKKENPQLTTEPEVVFREVSKDEQDIRRKYRKLKALATGYPDDSDQRLTFRLYITGNDRNTLDGYFNFRQRMNSWAADCIRGDEAATRKFKRVDGYWKSELQKLEARDESRFLFDIDEAIMEERHQLLSMLQEFTEVITWRETLNGYHVVTVPFNYNELETDIGYELKKDDLLFMEYLSRPNTTL